MNPTQTWTRAQGRDPGLWLMLSALGAALVLGGCGDDDSDPTRDAGGRDMGVPQDDGGTGEGFSLHYHRPDLTYAGWTAEVGGDVENPGSLSASGEDGFGAVYDIELSPGATTVTFQFLNGSESEPAEVVSVDVSGGPPGIWWFDGYDQALTREPPAIPGENQVAIHYVRRDQNYDGWGLHLWEDVAQETVWPMVQEPDGIDPDFGAWFLVDVQEGGDRVNLIVHRNEVKDPGPDMGFNISELGDIVFLRSGSANVYTVPQTIPPFGIEGMSAHWVSQDIILYDYPDAATQFELRFSETASVTVDDSLDIVGGSSVALSLATGELPEPVREKFPHLAARRQLTIADDDLERARAALLGQMVVVARDDTGTAVSATRVQIPGVLDELYSYRDPDNAAPLGASFAAGVPTLRVWAPTAQSVRLIRYDESLTELERLDMDRNDENGTWSITGDASWYGTHYQYLIDVYHPITDAVETFEVTDPYSVALSMNSQHSLIVDLDDDALKPLGWDALTLPPLPAPEDVVVYEGHVRDFSIFDETVTDPAHRGGYLAFTYDGTGAPLSDGMRHVQALADAGLTVFHVLPSFDIATVSEDPDERVDLGDGFDRLCMLNSGIPMEDCTRYGSMSIAQVLQDLDPSSADAQQVVTWMSGFDGFNWGYDPFHYTAPEGSYATDANGTARILEFRQMVASLTGLNLRTALDVVYNHTNASGTGPRSVLDKVVPGYYHRLNPDTGAVELSTCCDNTATEHVMMERLMIDSLVTWAEQYKIGSFRFDLMGHHMVSNMEAVRAALDAIDPSIFIYGEGWDFGEVQGGQRGRNATQLNMAGTGIGTFNDRLRDAVRGGGPFDSGGSLRSNQGFATGMFHQYNEANSGSPAERTTLLNQGDQIRVGMAGNLADFVLLSQTGTRAEGRQIDYNGSPTGYTQDPQETINYVSKHDNQTLFDIAAYKIATDTSMADRVRMHNLAVSISVLGQGIPFLHLGVDLLRSKSMERDSFDSGDWYNRVDWTGTTNNWNVGLPNAEKDMANWSTIEPILMDASIAPSADDIALARSHLRELLQIRFGTPLFRLATGEEVRTRVDYHNVGDTQIPGMIVQSITDGSCASADLDPNLDAVITIINGTPEEQSFELPGATGFALSDVLATSADTVVQAAGFDETTSSFTVPALTTAVFEQAQTTPTPGPGVPCNTR